MVYKNIGFVQVYILFIDFYFLLYCFLIIFFSTKKVYTNMTLKCKINRRKGKYIRFEMQLIDGEL